MSGLRPEVLKFAQLINARLNNMEAMGGPMYRNDSPVDFWRYTAYGAMSLIDDDFQNYGPDPWSADAEQWQDDVIWCSTLLCHLATISGVLATVPKEQLAMDLEA